MRLSSANYVGSIRPLLLLGDQASVDILALSQSGVGEGWQEHSQLNACAPSRSRHLQDAQGAPDSASSAASGQSLNSVLEHEAASFVSAHDADHCHPKGESSGAGHPAKLHYRVDELPISAELGVHGLSIQVYLGAHHLVMLDLDSSTYEAMSLVEPEAFPAEGVAEFVLDSLADGPPRSDVELAAIAHCELRTWILAGEPRAMGALLAQLRAQALLAPTDHVFLIPRGEKSSTPLSARWRHIFRYWRVQPLTGQEAEPAEWDLHQPHGLPAPPQHMILLGGTSSGKSQLAEDLLLGWPGVTYLATGRDLQEENDPDWTRRILRHQRRRPPWWQTQESVEVASLLETLDGPVLVDSLTTWLAQHLDAAGAWHDHSDWRDAVQAQISHLAWSWQRAPGPVIVVSDEVGMGGIGENAAQRLFAEWLGRTNTALAMGADEVYLCVAGHAFGSVGS